MPISYDATSDAWRWASPASIRTPGGLSCPIRNSHSVVAARPFTENARTSRPRLGSAPLEHGQVPADDQLAGPGRLEGVEAAELRRRAGPEVTSSAASNNPSLVSKYCSISHWVAGFGFLQSAPREGSTIGEPPCLRVSSARPACCTSARVKARTATRQKMSTVRANATCPSPQPRPPTV